MEKEFKSKKALITGGMGFIGSNLAIKLAELGAHVTIVDSLIPEYGGNKFNIEPVKDKVIVNVADVRDRHGMNHLVKGMDYLFNLAGQVSHLDSMTDPFTDLEINCTSQLSILEACRHNNPGLKTVFASTRQIYGKPQFLPVTEKHPLNPADVNGINKIAGEFYHTLYNNVYGIRAVSLRMTNTYGPRQLIKNNKQGFVGVFVRQAILGEEIKLFGTGQQLRDFNYIDDAVDALLLAAYSKDLDGKVYNLGSTEVVSLKKFAEILFKVSGGGKVTVVPFPEDKKKIDIGDYYGDFSAFNKATGWAPKVGLEEGLKRTVDYFRKNLKAYYPGDK